MADDERTLATRAAGHDAEAFAQLYDRFVDKIYKYVYYKVGTTQQAEDLTAQVFLKAWEAFQGYRWTERPFSAWLYRIAHNLVVDHFRAHRDAVNIEGLDLGDEHAVDMEELANQHLNGEILRRAIAQLTEDQQEVIVLKFLEGYSTVQVAEVMDKDPGAIRALQHRALGALQRNLGKVNTNL